MKVAVIALRNLLRNRRRSLMTLLSLMIGTTAILLFGGYSHNINYAMQTRYVQTGGHLQIQHRDYFLYGSGNSAAYGIPDYEGIILAIRQDPVLAPMLNVVTPTLQLGGIAGNYSAGVSRTVIATGVVVEDQNRLRLWNEYGLRLPLRPSALTGTDEDAAVIGNGVARVLKLCGPLKVSHCAQPAPAARAGHVAAPADIIALSDLEQPVPAAGDDTRIELLAASAYGAPNVASLRVVKAEDQGVKELDDIALTLHLAKAQRLLYGNERPQATAIIVQLRHTREMEAAKARLETLLATNWPERPLAVRDFATLNPFYGQSMNMFAAIFNFIAVLIGAIVLFTVGNTMSMAVVERTAEIGTLRAIGARRGGIRRLFISEGLMLGVIGVVLGVLAALLIAALINHSGLTWLPPGRVERVPLGVRVWGETGLILGTAVALGLVAVVSAWWPAKRAAGMNIVDALRHV